MTTWQEALEAFREDRDTALRLKQYRDSEIKNIEMKRPGYGVTRHAQKLYKEIVMNIFNLRKWKIKRKNNNSTSDMRS